MRDSVEISVEICREGVQLPAYAKEGDAGMDVRAAEPVEIKPRETVLIPTGLKVAIPDGYEIKTPLRLANAPGTIDAGYRDEICIIIQNTSEEMPYKIEKGDRIAQFVLQKVPKILFKEIKDVRKIGSDRGGGFGSTGVE